MNPARSFGPNIVGSLFVDGSLLPNNYWGFHFVYYLGPFVGALLAAVSYRYSKFLLNNNKDVSEYSLPATKE